MITLCLVNTYDKLKLHEIHLRSIARAAPLCYAYDMHLALLEFDFWKREEEMIEAVKNYTTIGGHGEYAVKLLEKGWVHLIERIPAHFGSVVATTSKPSQQKRLDMESLRKLLDSSATFLIGLGRKGLPKEYLKSSKYHLDVTFNGVSLETCSAMGAISVLLWMVREHGGHKSLPGTRFL